MCVSRAFSYSWRSTLILSRRSSELAAEVVFERELDASVVAVGAVEIRALAPEQLRTHEQVLHRRVQNVHGEVLALLERVALLAGEVIDLVVAVADRAAPGDRKSVVEGRRVGRVGR